MADYKVPQDVEADDKLIGPFSFRQFIYLIIVAMAIALAWALGSLFVGLAIIPLPIIIFFGALALPLRKDQPMEIYLAAIVSFYLKPRLRLWDAEGVESLIEITAPKTVEVKRTSDISRSEAEERISYLANIVDSQGWAIRGVAGATGTVGGAMNTDIFLEAQEAEDILDTNAHVAQNFGQMMAESTERVREEAVQRMMQAAAPQEQIPTQPTTQPQYDQQLAYQQAQQAYQQAYQQPQAQHFAQQQPPLQPQVQHFAQPQPQPQPLAQAYSTTPQPQAPFTQFSPSGEPALQFNPYPSSIKQSVIQPASEAIVPAAPTPNVAPTIEEIARTEPSIASNTSAKPKTTPKKVVKNTNTMSSTSGTSTSADIINLANNPDLSIKTIAHEARRIKKKASDDSGEVVISLR